MNGHSCPMGTTRTAGLAPCGRSFRIGDRGMTMVELMVSLAIVMLVIGSAATAYLKLLKTYKTQGRLAESYLANLTGLELIRYDIEMAGFGLPLSLGAGATYNEAVVDNTVPYDPTKLNDSTTNPPRAIAHLDNPGANGSDVLTIKSSAANVFNNPTGKRWSMIMNPAGGNPKVKLWGGTALDPVMDFSATTGSAALPDRFIILDNNGALQPAVGQWGCYTFNTSAANTGYYLNVSIPPSPLPYPSAQYVYYMYGLDNGNGAHRMPFNRVDYYLDKRAADFPSSCAASTFTLYRSTISQSTGALSYTPLLDCVRDFQVAFGLATNLDGNVNSWVQTLGTMTAAQIQQQLREVRVFLLYQEGLGDSSNGLSSAGNTPDFRFSGTLYLGDQDIANSLDPGDYPANNFVQWSSTPLAGSQGATPPQLSQFTPAGKDVQYRWKVQEIDIKPMNLN